MKRNLEIIKGHNATESIINMQDEDARKLLVNRERLLALNAIFDAALIGVPAKNMAKEIDLVHGSIAESFIQHLQDEKNSTEH